MINITTRNFTLTDSIQAYVESKIGKFEKFAKEGEDIYVMLESNRYGKKAEASLKIENKSVRASVVEDDLYVAVDLLMDKLASVIEKNNIKSNRKGGGTIRYAEPLSQIKPKEINKPKIVKRKQVISKPMFEEEAIEQMELLDHRSFLFLNATTGSVCMLYKRHDNDYGILETI